MLPPQLKAGFLKANNSIELLENMFHKDVMRMKNFQDWSEEQIKSIKAPTLIINGTKDVARVEHVVEMSRMIPDAELAIFPGGHGDYLGSMESLGNKSSPNFNAAPLICDYLG